VEKEARETKDRQPTLTGFALELVKDLLHGIEVWAADAGFHPAIQEPYQKAKSSIGE